MRIWTVGGNGPSRRSALLLQSGAKAATINAVSSATSPAANAKISPHLEPYHAILAHHPPRPLFADEPMRVRQRLGAEWSTHKVLALTSEQARANTAAGRASGAEGSITKIAKAASNQSLHVLAMDLLGAQATGWAPEDPRPAEFVTQFLRTRANSIEGGTSEVMLGIVAKRILDLPGA